MLDKIHPVLLAVLGVLGTFKNAIVETRCQEAQAFIGEKVTIRTHDGERIDGILKEIATHTITEEISFRIEIAPIVAVAYEKAKNLTIAENETQTKVIDIPVFGVISICEYQERVETPCPDFFYKHPLTGQKVEVTTQISRYVGILNDASNNQVAIETNTEGMLYLSGEYSLRAL